jgi:subtilase family serine protease
MPVGGRSRRVRRAGSRLLAIAATATMAATTAFVAPTAAGSKPARSLALGPRAGSGALVAQVRTAGRVASTNRPPTDEECRQQVQHPCYSPQEIRRAYGIDAFLQRGDDGTGQSIVIIDSFGSPTIASDLKVFDQGYGLPDPPSFKIYAPLGTVKFDPSQPDVLSWALETTLDVEWAHAVAPGASINLFTSPVDETQGVQGMPQFLYLEKYAIAHHLGQIISQSWGTTEETLFTTAAGRKVLGDFEAFYQAAAHRGVTVLASAGDFGTANPDVQGQIYPYPTIEYPAASPWVTAIGGTELFADTQGNYGSEIAWNDGGAGTGGGVSREFAEPSWQRDLPASVQQVLHGHRGMPDLAYNADQITSILIYLSFESPGYYPIAGTSEGVPQWAGIVADANQGAGRARGFLNPSLYRLGASGQLASVLHDVTVGHNGGIDGIRGYRAHPGWDLTTGWGTPKDVFSLFAG